MSPEAIQGGSNNPLGGAAHKVGRPSDVWSLGCILYQVRRACGVPAAAAGAAGRSGRSATRCAERAGGIRAGA